MYLKGHYQNAYVTHDLDRAIAGIEGRYGKTEWIVFEPDMVLQTPDGPKAASLRAALGWYGGLQLELIQPTKGWSAHYDPYLPVDRSDATPRFHHIAVRRDNLAAMRDELARLGLPLAFEGEVPDAMVYTYLDARASLGHYLEFVWATPEGWAMQGWPVGRPVW